MSAERQNHAQRLKRLLQIRQTLADAAEGQVRESTDQVGNLERAEASVAGNIQNIREEIAYSKSLSGNELHLNEKYIHTLSANLQNIKKNLENATHTLEIRRRHWRQAMSDVKLTEKLRDRRLQELSRKNEAANQKAMDDEFIRSLVRSRQE
jgi:flagellar export protein FliJ